MTLSADRAEGPPSTAPEPSTAIHTQCPQGQGHIHGQGQASGEMMGRGGLRPWQQKARELSLKIKWFL